QRHAAGDVILVRYADDNVMGFQYESEAKRFLASMRERLARFKLELHPDKTRLIRFGRYAAQQCKKRHLGKPETFDFLGFTHCCGRRRGGGFKIVRLTIKKRMRATLESIRAQLMSWCRFARLIGVYLPTVKLIHPHPSERFRVTTFGRSRMQ
ncbi:reverse transcriptase domain-containing protein, partial [Pseudomonas sp.]|uniref:reverse transcriptase domain-containing protein n=1 Tax=Pseudomonas sp. TaxID=306 RepID=UPI004053926B